MNWAGPEFVIWIVGLSTLGWVATTWIRARHGYALEDEWGGKTTRADHAATQQLRSENAELREQVDHFADRVKVLERIVTDRSHSLASEIETLRDPAALPAQRDQNGAH